MSATRTSGDSNAADARVLTPQQLKDAGLEKIEAWAWKEEPGRVSAAAARKSKSRAKLQQQGLKQLNLNVSEDPHVREALKLVARALTEDPARAEPLGKTMGDPVALELIVRVSDSPREVLSALERPEVLQIGQQLTADDRAFRAATIAVRHPSIVRVMEEAISNRKFRNALKAMLRHRKIANLVEWAEHSPERRDGFTIVIRHPESARLGLSALEMKGLLGTLVRFLIRRGSSR